MPALANASQLRYSVQASPTAARVVAGQHVVEPAPAPAAEAAAEPADRRVPQGLMVQQAPGAGHPGHVEVGVAAVAAVDHERFVDVVDRVPGRDPPEQVGL